LKDPPTPRNMENRQNTGVGGGETSIGDLGWSVEKCLPFEWGKGKKVGVPSRVLGTKPYREYGIKGLGKPPIGCPDSGRFESARILFN